jgi:hypothetical protein
VVLADRKHIEADLVGQLDFLEQVPDPLGIARRAAFRGGHKTVYADLHACSIYLDRLNSPVADPG